MKKFFLFFLIIELLIFSTGCEKEKIFEGSPFVGFSPQSIDDLKSFYEGGFSVINNGLYLKNLDEVENLKYLSNVTIVNGPVVIESNVNLTSLEGLGNLTSINSTNSFFGSLSISDNTKLKSLEGLDNLKKIEQSLFITENPELEDCKSLKNLQELNSYFYFSRNDKVVSLTGIGNEVQIIDEIKISDSEKLVEITCFENLTEMRQQISIHNNPNLRAIHGFSNLTKLSVLEIRSNEKLETINSFQKLDSINNELIIEDNNIPNLLFLSNINAIGSKFVLKLCSSIKSLEGLNHSEFFINNPHITILNNDSLINLCAIQNMARSMTGFSSYTVEDNAFNPTKDDLINGECSPPK